MIYRIAVLLALLLLLVRADPYAASSAGLPNTLVVSPTGPFTTIQAALAQARDGDLIEVRGGVYRGPLVVAKTVTLQGVDLPVVDNGGDGTVVTLAAPGAILRGFELRGSGAEYDRDHSGITITAPRVTVEDNRLRDVLFGIFVSRASDAVLRDNDITSKDGLDIGLKGDAIRVWYSPRVTIQGNHVHRSRDVVIWYSSQVVLRDNLFERGRYGVHLMYCDHALIERNRLFDNSVGIYTMYSNESTIRENLIRGQRGPSGYALGFKDADDIDIVDNALVDNRAGVFLDGTPFNPQAYARFRENILAFNDVGVIMMPAVRGATFQHNSFWENTEQVSVAGGGLLGKSEWVGNYWSDYAGFDTDGKGTGNTPYRSERFFEGMMDREPLLRMLIYSPAAQAVEFAASAFPLMRPQPKFVDPAPQVQALPVPPFALEHTANGGALALVSLAMILLGAVAGALALKGSNWMRVTKSIDRSTEASPQPKGLGVLKVTKQFGKVKVLQEVSFRVEPGEALALWGPNGAGKTTLLKAILGLIDFQGEIKVEGFDVKHSGKQARQRIGYVPQEALFYDLPVRATLEFYARLKKADPARIKALLTRVGLADHATKPVPALSGGLKQRLALALALLADPPVLLLDEPTANLDAEARSDYLRLLASLHHDGRTILFASHRIEEVQGLADRVLMLEGGRACQVISPEQLAIRLSPHIEMTLWVEEAERALTKTMLGGQGMSARLNGRGTVIVNLRADQKMMALNLLREHGVTIHNFEVTSWD